MTVDRFWKFFWIGSGGIVLFGILMAASLFVFYTRQGDLLAAVGVTYDPNKDPFAGATIPGLGVAGGADGIISLSSGYLYQNSLPLHFKSWTWESTADWRSSEQVHEGNAALKTIFNVAGGTVGMNGPIIDVRTMKSISLAVYASGAVGEVYLNLYDKNGNAFKMQSLGWYTPSGTLTPNTWQNVVIPLRNFGDTVPASISGFSVSGQNPGVAYIDAVQLSKTDAQHDPWVAPPPATGQAFNPFATSTPVGLPYTFSPTSDALAKWYSYFGYFGPGGNGEIALGPSEAAKTTGSMTVFRGGRNWSDYHVNVTIDWGEVSVFSLLARFVNDGDFVSCAFSRYGEGVQLYQMIKGSSNLLLQTPPLAVKDYQPWVGVQMGMEVSGNRVSCFVDGEEVLHKDLSSMPAQGTTGFETWDPNPAAAPHTLRSFTVKPVSSE
jgi:hypothetical protein